MNKEVTSLPDTMLDDVPLAEPRATLHRPMKAWVAAHPEQADAQRAEALRIKNEHQERLWNNIPHQTEHIQKEKPVHATMAHMAANGYTNQEIASFTGYCVQRVNKVLAQPFAQERMLKAADKNSREEIKAFLEKETMPSLQVIRDLRDNLQVAPAVRGSMANLLVERFLGKAVQPIDPNAKPVSEMKDEDLKADVESILQQTRVN